MEYTLDKLATMADEAVAAIKYPATAPGLYQPIQYALESGGKRLRPALCLAAYAALSGRAPEEAVSQAMAIEMFHNFTLLHDDVMDRADTRRGRPAVHVRWGENAAILSGDTMLTMAYDLLAEGAGDRFASLFRLFSTTAMEVYQGQQLDMEFEDRDDVSVPEYMEMIRLKTSVLLGCACRTGAEMAGADARTCDSLYDYGIALGLAFQLRDDWLDTYGDPAVFGKQIGGDILNNKKTWLLITAMEEDPEAIFGIQSEDLAPEEKIRQVTKVYDSLKLRSRCDELAASYAVKAREALDGIALPDEFRTLFNSLADNAAKRDH